MEAFLGIFVGWTGEGGEGGEVGEGISKELIFVTRRRAVEETTVFSQGPRGFDACPSLDRVINLRNKFGTAKSGLILTTGHSKNVPKMGL